MGVMAEIRSALQAGASREQLEEAGYKRSSIYLAAKQLAKPGDGRRHGIVQRRTNPGVRPVTPIAALPAPSSELSDKREQLQLAKLANELTVEQLKTARLQPETPEPPNEISNARAMIGLISDAKALFPAPETPVLTPVSRGLSPVQQLEIDIKRLEMLERNEERAQVREQQAQERRTEVYQEIGGYISKGLTSFLGVLQEVKAATPARVRAPALNANAKVPVLEGGGSGKFPAMIRSADGKTWTRPVADNMVAENPVSEIALQPADRPGGTWIASADAETGEVISWAWAKDPPAETVNERLRRLGQDAAGIGATSGGTVSVPVPQQDQKSRFSLVAKPM